MFKTREHRVGHCDQGRHTLRVCRDGWDKGTDNWDGYMFWNKGHVSIYRQDKQYLVEVSYGDFPLQRKGQYETLREAKRAGEKLLTKKLMPLPQGLVRAVEEVCRCKIVWDNGKYKTMSNTRLHGRQERSNSSSVRR